MMKTVDRLFNKHMTVRKGYIDYMSRNAFHRAMEEYATQPASEQGEEGYIRLLKPNYKSKDGTIKPGLIMAPKSDLPGYSTPQPEPTNFREKVREIIKEADEKGFAYGDTADTICSLLPDVTEEDILSIIFGNTTGQPEYIDKGPDSYCIHGITDSGIGDAAKAILELFRKEGR